VCRASRISILFSIVRIDPSATRRRRLFWVAVAFVIALLFLLAQLLWVCEPEPSWKDAPNPQCHLPLQVAICQLVSEYTLCPFAAVQSYRCTSRCHRGHDPIVRARAAFQQLGRQSLASQIDAHLLDVCRDHHRTFNSPIVQHDLTVT
jgi:hypothetical protein